MWAPLLPSSHPIEPRPKEPAQATLLSLQPSPSYTPPRNSNPSPLFYPFIPSLFPLIFSSFSIVLLCFDSIFASFYLGRVEWTRGESNPTVTQLPPATSASKSIQNRPRWPPQLCGEVPQNGPCFEPPPPRPPILTSFTMSNFAMLDSWLS